MKGYQAGEKLRVWCAERSLPSIVQWKVVELGPGAERRAGICSGNSLKPIPPPSAAETKPLKKSAKEAEVRFHIGLKGLVCWRSTDKRQYVVYCRELNGDVAVLPRDALRNKEKDPLGEWVLFDVVKHGKQVNMAELRSI